MKQENIVVTLDGQGADELLAGYNGYPEFYLKSLLTFPLTMNYSQSRHCRSF